MSKWVENLIETDGGEQEAGGGSESPVVETDWLHDDEMRAWRTYIEASDRLSGVLNRSLQSKHGMTMDDYRILVLLSEAPERSLRMSDLAQGIVASRSKLTHQIRRLENAGIVEREECPSDKRGVLARLTDKGLESLQQAAPDRRLRTTELQPEARRRPTSACKVAGASKQLS